MADDKRKVLWVSALVPYDKVPHAGGKTHNFYVKGLHKSGLFDIKLVTFAAYNELPNIDLADYGIDNHIILFNTNILKRIFWGIWWRIHRWNFLSRDAGNITPFVKHSVMKVLRELKRSGYAPDVIVLQWTSIVLLKEYISELFPGVPVVAVEEDVSYLGSKRQMEFETSLIKRYFKKKLYTALKHRELQALRESRLTIVNNVKDKKLLQTDDSSIKLFMWAPYFMSYLPLEHKGGTKDIIFYGAMSRPENYLSSEWFIKNVMPLLSKDYRFIIIGNGPHESLMKYQFDRVIITGFVDDPSPYFQSALCLAASLLLGAGVKIKVIEALSAGLPVLTNTIGIEGIEAVNGESYFHCETPQEYADVIIKLGNGEIDSEKVSAASKKLVREKHNYEETLKGLIEIMRTIA